jgi:hypothetical protein
MRKASFVVIVLFCVIFTSSAIAQPGGASSPPGAVAGFARPVPPGALHVEGHVTLATCGRPLEFSLTVQNRSDVAFNGSAAIRVTSDALQADPGELRGAFSHLPAHGEQTFKVTSNPVKTDCVAPRKFLVTLVGQPGVQPLPAWDHDALELSTTPPTNCQATTSSRRYQWNPKT